jgi:hypothetical protein
MALGAFLADVLADLHFLKGPDHPGAQEKADQKGRDRGVDGSKRDVPEHVEERDVRVQGIK